MKFLTKELRAALSKPQGKLMSGAAAAKALRKARGTIIAIVGDAAAFTLRKAGIAPSLIVYDLKTKRRPVASSERRFFESLPARKLVAVNPPGTLTTALFSAMRRAFSAARRGKAAKLFVKGEEDLGVIPAVIAAPLNALVVYGQPDKGLVVIRVTAAAKKKVQKIYARFSKKPEQT